MAIFNDIIRALTRREVKRTHTLKFDADKYIVSPTLIYNNTDKETYPALWSEDMFNEWMNEAIDQTSESETKTWLLSHDLWYRVFPFNNMRMDGYSYEVHHRYDGKWSAFGSNSLWSSSHLLPCFETKEEATKAALDRCEQYIIQQKELENNDNSI